LHTNEEFEKIFNLQQPINDRTIFANKIEEFENAWLSKERLARRSRRNSPNHVKLLE